MYSLSIPVAQLRTKMRQEFERHRYVKQTEVVDVLLFKSHSEYQVRWDFLSILGLRRGESLWIQGHFTTGFKTLSDLRRYDTGAFWGTWKRRIGVSGYVRECPEAAGQLRLLQKRFCSSGNTQTPKKTMFLPIIALSANTQ